MKKAAAAASYAMLTSHLDAQMRASIVESLVNRARPDGDADTWIEDQECPVCSSRGWLTCEIVRGELQYEQTNWHDQDIWVNRTAVPYLFECAVCGLELADDGFSKQIFLTRSNWSLTRILPKPGSLTRTCGVTGSYGLGGPLIDAV